MSLMGVLMLVGISASNSILIVEFAHRLEEQGNRWKMPSLLRAGSVCGPS